MKHFLKKMMLLSFLTMAPFVSAKPSEISMVAIAGPNLMQFVVLTEFSPDGRSTSVLWSFQLKQLVSTLKLTGENDSTDVHGVRTIILDDKASELKILPNSEGSKLNFKSPKMSINLTLIDQSDAAGYLKMLEFPMDGVNLNFNRGCGTTAAVVETQKNRRRRSK